MPDVLAILEQRGGTLKKVSHETLTAARHLADGLNGEVHALLIGAAEGSGDGLGAFGADKVLRAGDEELRDYQADRYAAIGITKHCHFRGTTRIRPVDGN